MTKDYLNEMEKEHQFFEQLNAKRSDTSSMVNDFLGASTSEAMRDFENLKRKHNGNIDKKDSSFRESDKTADDFLERYRKNLEKEDRYQKNLEKNIAEPKERDKPSEIDSLKEMKDFMLQMEKELEIQKEINLQKGSSGRKL